MESNMKNISFNLTTAQIRNRTKTVTRRLGWTTLKAGTILQACEKCQGLKKGEKVRKICQIRVRNVRREYLGAMADVTAYGNLEATREGFPELSGVDFVNMFCKNMKVSPDDLVTRIEFDYVGD